MSRSKLLELRASLHPGQPLDEESWLQIVGILDVIAEGYDVRKQFGIPPKPGTPPKTRFLQKWLVLHALALCAEDPDTPEKVHFGTVAVAWNKSDKQVGKLVRELRKELQPLVMTAGIEAIVESARILQAEYRRLTPNRP